MVPRSTSGCFASTAGSSSRWVARVLLVRRPRVPPSPPRSGNSSSRRASTRTRWTGGVGMRYGMSEEDALKALTINGAKIARVGDRVGSIETGKDADLIICDGPWYELKTRVDQVYVDGTLVYDRKRDEK